MDTQADEIWIEACAHRLQRHWRTVESSELAATARQIAQSPELRALAPSAAAARESGCHDAALPSECARRLMDLHCRAQVAANEVLGVRPGDVVSLDFVER